MALNFGNNLGNGLGAEMQAYLDKTLLTNMVQETMFDRYATITKTLPLHSSKQIEFRKWITMKDLMLASNINKSITGNVQDVATSRNEETVQTIGKDVYSNFVLPEGSSGAEHGDMKRIKVSATVFPIGMWMGTTEELQTFDDMYTIAENVKQYGEYAGLITDGYYRDLYANGAGHVADITSETAGQNNVADANFTAELRKLSLKLRLSGAKYVNSVLTSSANYGTTPVRSKYILVVHPLVADKLKDNANFTPIEEYAAGTGTLENEEGIIGDFRVITNDNAYIEDDGAGAYNAEMITFGRDHTAQIPLRGKNRVQVIVKGLGQNGNDPLNRVGTVGWKTWLGAKVLYPERLAVVKAKVTF